VRIIEIRPSKKLRNYWEAFEGEGVQPAFPTKQHAVDYASNRFGGSSGEIQIYDDSSENMVKKIAIEDRIKYPHAD
jgi:hypothetical protein